MKFELFQILFAVAFVLNLTEAGQLCSSCVDIASPEDCDRHTKCDDTEQCYHRQYTRGSSPLLYELGCISSQACTTTPLIGKRSSAGLHFKCFACCNDTALCNQMSDCGNVPTTPTTHRTILPTLPAVLPRDCSELRLANNRNGSYTIYPYGASDVSASVWCEFDSDGAWTVIQRRFNGSVDFYRNWTEYKRGFGSSDSEYWLGNDFIHQLTSLENYSLKIVLTNWTDFVRYEEYKTFYIANETDNYALKVNGYSGSAGDGLTWHNGMQFSTRDRDNDVLTSVNCVSNCGKGAWWHRNCCWSSLNSVYSLVFESYLHGIVWYSAEEGQVTLKSTKMMIKKNNG